MNGKQQVSTKEVLAVLFNSVDFLIFFPIVVLIFFLVPAKLRCYWLLAASYFFYMCWNAQYIFLIAASTVVTWGCGRIVMDMQSRAICTVICWGIVSPGILWMQ